MTVQRIGRKHDVRPHRLDRHMISNDPNFETKAADVIGLYLNPPAHAAVFCVDEKTAIQALDHKDRMLPWAPGRAQSHGFEYKRNGTLSLFAALNTATGEVLGKTAARHTSEQFVGFLGEIADSQDGEREIHVICDNVSSHKTDKVEAFLVEHPNVKIHYTSMQVWSEIRPTGGQGRIIGDRGTRLQTPAVLRRRKRMCPSMGVI